MEAFHYRYHPLVIRLILVPFRHLSVAVSQVLCLAEAAEFFFVAPDGGGDGVQC
ncbi:MAG: hypothetical protein JWR32_2569, partial [Mycobacterium sp.]|nr:hypothetical protein [Mycobacterium sp.]